MEIYSVYCETGSGLQNVWMNIRLFGNPINFVQHACYFFVGSSKILMTNISSIVWKTRPKNSTFILQILCRDLLLSSCQFSVILHSASLSRPLLVIWVPAIPSNVSHLEKETWLTKELKNVIKLYCFIWGTAVAQWLRCCATNQKVAGSIPDGVIGIFHWHNPSDRTMTLRSTQPLTEMSTRSISWG